MNLDKSINKKSPFFFAFFFLLVLVAFWPGYFSRLFGDMEIRFHTHGISMILWCLMLIIQPYLIYTKKNNLHKMVGKASYIIMPLVIITAINLMHFRLRGLGNLNNGHFYFIALVINALVILAIIYGLAIYHKKKKTTHARYMICTVFPMITPVTDRLIYMHLKPLVGFAPVIDGVTMVPVLGFILADIIVLILAIWDWRANKKLNVFPVVLVLLILYHASVLTFHKISWWRSFGEWFIDLNLS